jgi:hypothetical protein
MPRGFTLYEEAQWRGALWTPGVLSPGVWVQADRSQLTWASANNISSVQNIGTSCAAFNAQGTNYAQLIQVNNRTYFNWPNDVSGLLSSSSFSLQPSSGLSAYVVALPQSGQFGSGVITQYSSANSILLSINPLESFAFYDGSWRSRTVGGVASNTPVIVSQRKTASSATTMRERFFTGGTLYDANITVGNFTASSTSVALFGRISGGSGATVRAHSVLWFPRYLSDAEDDMVTGYLAWAGNQVAALPASHPFANTPPLAYPLRLRRARGVSAATAARWRQPSVMVT